MATPSREASRFASSIWLVLVIFVVFLTTFFFYVRSEKEIDHSNELREFSLQLAADLHHSSDDLTNMARTYVVTGQAIYRDAYQEILDIREGRRPRPADYGNAYWDRGLKANRAAVIMEPPMPLLERMRQAGFTAEELSRLADAKASLDALTRVEFAAMAMVERAGAVSEASRFEAIRMLHDAEYLKAKSDLMRLIGELGRLADERTKQVVHKAEAQATQVRWAFVALGLLLAFLLWNLRRNLHAILGGGVGDVYDAITRLGSGDFVSTLEVREGTADSVLGWLAETQRKLAHMDGERRQVQRDMEQLLVEQKAMLENEVVGIMRLKGRTITWINAAAEKMLGYGHGELVGKPTRAFYPSDESFNALGAAAYPPLSRGEIFRTQIALVRKDGGETWVDINGAAMDRDGEESIWCVVDISDQRRGEREQQRLNRALRLLGDCNLALFRAVDESGLLSDICRLIVQTGGYVMSWIAFAEHDPQKSVRAVARFGHDGGYVDRIDVSWDENLPVGQGPIGRAIRTGKTQINQDYLSNPAMAPWREAATRCGYRSSIGLALSTEDQIIGVLNIYAADVGTFNSQEVSLLEELARNLSFGIQTLRTRDRRQAAEAASIAKSSFLANMSHEIRTPMNAILGMAHLMRRSGVTPKQSAQLDKIAAASEHLLHIINDVLDLSKIEAGKLTLEETDVVVESILGNVASIISPRINDKGLRLFMHTENLPRYLRGDPTRLAQALLNYANNAVKFTDSGSITIRGLVMEESDAAVLLRFEVQDTGRGLEPDVIDRVFGAFEQADTSTTREHGGTGLGLAITKRLAQLMGGDTGVTSSPGNGSTFWFTACLRKASDVEVAERDTVSERAESVIAREFHGRRLLLTEDDPINQEVALELLSDTGLLIDVACDGRQAVQMATANDYDLILMDVQMPRLDGLDATRQIRAVSGRAAVPIIAMTANAFIEDKTRCIDAGMSDFLPKPVEPEALYETLLKWLKKENIGSDTAGARTSPGPVSGAIN